MLGKIQKIGLNFKLIWNGLSDLKQTSTHVDARGVSSVDMVPLDKRR